MNPPSPCRVPGSAQVILPPGLGSHGRAAHLDGGTGPLGIQCPFLVLCPISFDINDTSILQCLLGVLYPCFFQALSCPDVRSVSRE